MCDFTLQKYKKNTRWQKMRQKKGGTLDNSLFHPTFNIISFFFIRFFYLNYNAFICTKLINEIV